MLRQAVFAPYSSDLDDAEKKSRAEDARHDAQ
jgi:hypothetical protein